jgi:hypothetical protein
MSKKILTCQIANEIVIIFYSFYFIKKIIRNYQQNIFYHYLHRKLTTKFFISIFVAIY